MFYILWLLWPCMDLWSENKQIQIQISRSPGLSNFALTGIGATTTHHGDINVAEHWPLILIYYTTILILILIYYTTILIIY